MRDGSHVKERTIKMNTYFPLLSIEILLDVLDQNLTAGCQVSLTNYDASSFNNQIKKYIDKPFS